MTTRNNILQRVLLITFILLFPFALSSQTGQQEKRAMKIEQKADKLFIRQEFRQAMREYNSIFKTLPDIHPGYRNYLHLKVANLYVSLLSYNSAVKHFEAAGSTDPSIFAPDDLCNYVEALRNSGANEKALQVCKEYTARDAYKNHQRLNNILQALLIWEEDPEKEPEAAYEVGMLDLNTPYPEYSIARFKEYIVYTLSHSQFHDPQKRFYPRTKLHLLENTKRNTAYFSQAGSKASFIPVDLQTGVVTFSDDNLLMIITEIIYDKNDRIFMTAKGPEFYTTQLTYSFYHEERNGWSKLEPVFPEIEKEHSYAYPFLFNDNHSLLFSSNAFSKEGNFDICLTHWNDILETWEDPVRLGKEINTDGDEIAPALFGNRLFFASNGHVGLGGYDIYSVEFKNNKVVPGTLIHYEYPLNTVYNDFFISPVSEHEGFLISDRNRHRKDDIFTYKALERPVIIEVPEPTPLPVEVPEEIVKEEPPAVKIPETICSVYFGFDKYELDRAALDTLNRLIQNISWEKVEYMEIVGYADPMGAWQYNQWVSERRARTVANYLRTRQINIRQDVGFVGAVTLTPEEIRKEEEKLMKQYGDRPEAYGIADSRKTILLNRQARRVDIKVIYATQKE